MIRRALCSIVRYIDTVLFDEDERREVEWIMGVVLATIVVLLFLRIVIE